MPAIPQPGAVAGQGGVPAAPTPPPLPAPITPVAPAAAAGNNGVGNNALKLQPMLHKVENIPANPSPIGVGLSPQRPRAAAATPQSSPAVIGNALNPPPPPKGAINKGWFVLFNPKGTIMKGTGDSISNVFSIPIAFRRISRYEEGVGGGLLLMLSNDGEDGVQLFNQFYSEDDVKLPLRNAAGRKIMMSNINAPRANWPETKGKRIVGPFSESERKNIKGIIEKALPPGSKTNISRTDAAADKLIADAIMANVPHAPSGKPVVRPPGVAGGVAGNVGKAPVVPTIEKLETEIGAQQDNPDAELEELVVGNNQDVHAPLEEANYVVF